MVHEPKQEELNAAASRFGNTGYCPYVTAEMLRQSIKDDPTMAAGVTALSVVASITSHGIDSYLAPHPKYGYAALWFLVKQYTETYVGKNYSVINNWIDSNLKE